MFDESEKYRNSFEETEFTMVLKKSVESAKSFTKISICSVNGPLTKSSRSREPRTQILERVVDKWASERRVLGRAFELWGQQCKAVKAIGF